MDSYNNIAEIYSEETNKSELSKEYDYILRKFFKLINGDNILDAGCGNSPTTTKYTNTVGLDFSSGQLNQCNNTDAELIMGDMINIPIENNIFDGIVSFYSLIHIPTDSKKSVFKEFKRVIKDNGYMLIVVGSNEWKGSNDNWLDSNIEMKWDMSGPKKIKEQLTDVGFNIIEQVKVNSSLGEGDCKTFILVENNENI